MRQVFAVIFLALLFFSGCSLKTPNTNQTLGELLQSIGTPKEEALLLDKKAHDYALTLKDNYGSKLPPVWHNTFVNLGFKSRGLCWHYAHDLYEYIAPLTKSLDAVIVVAHLGSWMKEHSALVLTCLGCSIEEGVVLDAWRDRKKLIYLPVKEDIYPWRPR
ncbi:MAG: hypothetical protein GX780_05920 [Campylobacteraceae bacterium]|nr:hypothetical protein [Campylobacteraceae bacterium]